MAKDNHKNENPFDENNLNDIELRELVYQSLERDGLITRLKAQLRAAVFRTIEKASNTDQIKFEKPSYEGLNGQICRELVFDWLQHAELLYTQDIFQVETSGPNHPEPLTKNELFKQLNIDSDKIHSQPILHFLINQNNKTNNRIEQINSLPEHIKESIDKKFPTEKINDTNRIREHFRTLFQSSFDVHVLDTFINKNLTSTSIAKVDYEKICLKWLQSCAKALTSSNEIKQPLTSRNGQIVTKARRSTSPPSESNSSSNSSSSENQRKGSFDLKLPTTTYLQKGLMKKTTDLTPPPLKHFNTNSTNDDDEDDTSSPVYSARNATPAALNRLKNIDDIIRGDETPRPKPTNQKSNFINKDIPVEYDDENTSQISTIDDVTVDRASPSSSTHIDFFEDI